MTRNYSVWISQMQQFEPLHIYFKLFFRDNSPYNCNAPEADNILEVYYANRPDYIDDYSGICYYFPQGQLFVHQDQTPNYGFNYLDNLNLIIVNPCNNRRAYFEVDSYFSGNIDFYINLPSGYYQLDFAHYRTYASSNHSYKLVSESNPPIFRNFNSGSLTGFINVSIFYYHSGGRLYSQYHTKRWGGLSAATFLSAGTEAETRESNEVSVEVICSQPSVLKNKLINTKTQSVNEMGAIAGLTTFGTFSKTELASETKLLKEVFA